MAGDALGALPYVYVTTRGRVTGRPREIEIWYVLWQGCLYIFAERFHKAQWVKNIAKDPRVTLRLDDRRFQASARVLDLERDTAEWRTVQQLACDKYGWGDGLPVRITPDEPL